ncbi:MAG: TIGR01777 family oxidoreductase [Gemmatimonadota bacterium]
MPASPTPLIVTRATRIAAPREALWQWHAALGAFERLVPPWQRVEVIHGGGALTAGSTVTLRLARGPFRVRWRLTHPSVEAGHGFSDEQITGPFAAWRHEHRFEDDGAASRLVDRISVRLPGGRLGKTLAGGVVRGMLEQLLRYRHAVTRDDLEQQARHPLAPMRIAITGASGLVGSALTPFLRVQGHEVIPISRRAIAGGIQWDPSAGQLDSARLEGLDAVIHLAGASIASGRWTVERKALLRESRIRPTSLLATRLAGLARPPRLLISASAVGAYGSRGDETLSEASTLGEDFLALLARDWEAAAEPARQAGIRVVHPRFGVVLSPRGGALAKLLTPFGLGLGGPVGSGSQWLAWIGIDDLLGVLHHLLASDQLAGPVNAVSPHALTNAEFGRTLGRVLGRPAVLPLPAPVLRLAFGEMADATLLASQRVDPTALGASGYRWRHPDLEGALRHLLGRQRPDP